MAENLSWIGNQPDRCLSIEPSNDVTDSGYNAVSMSKQKQPFLRKGSGNVQKRLAASKERKYVPKGGFLKDCVTMPAEASHDEQFTGVEVESPTMGDENVSNLNSGDCSASNLKSQRQPLAALSFDSGQVPCQWTGIKDAPPTEQPMGCLVLEEVEDIELEEFRILEKQILQEIQGEVAVSARDGLQAEQDDGLAAGSAMDKKANNTRHGLPQPHPTKSKYSNSVDDFAKASSLLHQDQQISPQHGVIDGNLKMDNHGEQMMDLGQRYSPSKWGPKERAYREDTSPQGDSYTVEHLSRWSVQTRKQVA
eukprot:jgi/Botrbrau1/21268/Bobra.39_2s0058.1